MALVKAVIALKANNTWVANDGDWCWRLNCLKGVFKTYHGVRLRTRKNTNFTDLHINLSSCGLPKHNGYANTFRIFDTWVPYFSNLFDGCWTDLCFQPGNIRELSRVSASTICKVRKGSFAGNRKPGFRPLWRFRPQEINMVRLQASQQHYISICTNEFNEFKIQGWSSHWLRPNHQVHSFLPYPTSQWLRNWPSSPAANLGCKEWGDRMATFFKLTKCFPQQSDIMRHL